jgi:hypothetical protein
MIPFSEAHSAPASVLRSTYKGREAEPEFRRDHRDES